MTKKAVIDLGTNTFHLIIANKNEIIYKVSQAVKLGKGGINKNTILPDAIERAISTLKSFKKKIDEEGVEIENVKAIGTSAIRNAANQKEFLAKVQKRTGIIITVVDGDREAELIFKGVNSAVEISDNALIVDIGGGSVEFVICNNKGILWKKSIEMGGQRLMELFMTKDPISGGAIEKMNGYFREQLLPLANACHQYHPHILIGSSGSFDTINDIYCMQEIGNLPSEDAKAFSVPVTAFFAIYEQFIFKNREERMLIPGMIELRVEMIVVASCLIRYIIQNFEINELKVSNFALKEGVITEFFHA